MVGTVVDSSGAAVANAEVPATNVATGLAITNRTNNTGEYRFDNLPIGNYKFTVKANGFRTTTELAEVVLNRTGTVNVSLRRRCHDRGSLRRGCGRHDHGALESSYDSRLSQDLGITRGRSGSRSLEPVAVEPGGSNSSALNLGKVRRLAVNAHATITLRLKAWTITARL